MKHALLATTLLASLPLAAHADSFQNMSDATGDSAEASARLVASGVQVTMGAAAVPLAAVGALTEAGGEAATTISDDLWAAANAPLEVDDTIVMSQPLPELGAQRQQGEEQ